MSDKIEISPVTRIEGHAKVSLLLDSKGRVESARFHATAFRGFEKFCEGRMVWEMPLMTSRICGLCPTSHHLASVKACEDLMGVEPPPVAKKLRELMHLGGMLQDHAAHFFFLAAPDFLYPKDVSKRHVFSILADEPELGRIALKLRQVGQTILERVGGRAIHSVSAIPGGMSKPLRHEERFELLGMVDEYLEPARQAFDAGKEMALRFAAARPDLGTIAKPMLALSDGPRLSLLGGALTLLDATGKKIAAFDGGAYTEYLDEHVEEWSYAKFPFYKPLGYPEGTYRTGPLARLNVASETGIASLDAELARFKELGDGAVVQSAAYYHYARLIEMLYSIERAAELLRDDEIVSGDVRVKAERRAGEGVGVIEAPRGVLIHHYVADEVGKLQKANFIVATTNNNQAINESVGAVARSVVKGRKIEEPQLNQIEMALRCYDPCLSCSTHLLGKSPFTFEILSKDEIEDRARGEA